MADRVCGAVLALYRPALSSLYPPLKAAARVYARPRRLGFRDHDRCPLEGQLAAVAAVKLALPAIAAAAEDALRSLGIDRRRALCPVRGLQGLLPLSEAITGNWDGNAPDLFQDEAPLITPMQDRAEVVEDCRASASPCARIRCAKRKVGFRAADQLPLMARAGTRASRHHAVRVILTTPIQECVMRSAQESKQVAWNHGRMIGPKPPLKPKHIWAIRARLQHEGRVPPGLRRTKVANLYKRTGNLRACQLLLGHTKLESTVRCLGIEVDDALILSEQVDL